MNAAKGPYIRRQDFDAFEHILGKVHCRWHPIVRVGRVDDFSARNVLLRGRLARAQITSFAKPSSAEDLKIRFANYYLIGARRSRFVLAVS
jgi:hypothetical protein